MNQVLFSEDRLKRTLQEYGGRRRGIQGKAKAVIPRIGLAAGPHMNVALERGPPESGVVNWTGERSTKALLGQATLTNRGHKTQV